jgi:hypothetical protein
MEKIDQWPPPNWTEVVIKWEQMLESPDYNPNIIVTWVDHVSGGRYHLHGYNTRYNTAEGFAFRFEDPKDATLFALRWA